jgi:hypothetical protein
VYANIAFTLVCAFTLNALALAHDHADVEFHPDGGNLVVPPMNHEGELLYVFPGHFGEEVLDPANFTDHPGFAGEDLAAGDTFGFNVVRELLYWDGAALAPAPTEHGIAIRNVINTVTVAGDSAFQSGFTFAEADADGDVHQHVNFTLHGPGEPDALVPGGYGLWLELTSPRYGASNGFVIMLNYGLDEEAFEAGVHYVGEHVIPEPSALALFGALALFAARRRA